MTIPQVSLSPLFGRAVISIVVRTNLMLARRYPQIIALDIIVQIRIERSAKLFRRKRQKPTALMAHVVIKITKIPDM